MKLTSFIALFASIGVSTPTLASTYEVIKIYDGDTISVVNRYDGSTKRIRLACIDAPEHSQPQGKLSSITLSAFIPVGSKVELNIVDTDKYGRSVAEILKNRVNVNQSLLKKGQAIVYHRYLYNCPNPEAYIKAEQLAKDRKQGLWRDSNFITPEDWRRGVRTVAAESIETTNSRNSGSGRGYISGSCKYLKTLGLSRFTPGDANYTRRRDRDGDGVACE